MRDHMLFLCEVACDKPLFPAGDEEELLHMMSYVIVSPSNHFSLKQRLDANTL